MASKLSVCPHTQLPLDPPTPQALLDSLTVATIGQARARIVGDPTDDHIGRFLWACREARVSPWSGILRAAVKRDGDLDLGTTVEGYRSIAERSGRLYEIKPPTFVYDAEPGAVRLASGVRRDEIPFAVVVAVVVRRSLSFRPGQRRRGRRESGLRRARFSAIAFRSEWDTGSEHWLARPRYHLSLRAEGLALRQAFPELLHGIRLRSDGIEFPDDDKRAPDPPAVPDMGGKNKPIPRPTSGAATR